MTNQTSELINFFQKALQAGTVERDQKKYLTKYRSEIEAAGQVFQYLELAKPDSKSALGWKPTKRLLDLIAKSNRGPLEGSAEVVRHPSVAEPDAGHDAGFRPSPGLSPPLYCVVDQARV